MPRGNRNNIPKKPKAGSKGEISDENNKNTENSEILDKDGEQTQVENVDKITSSDEELLLDEPGG